MHTFRSGHALVVASLLSLAVAAPVSAAEARRQIDRTFTVATGESFSLLNLAGNVTITRAAGTELKVSATVHAEAGSQAEAERLAELLKLAVDESGAKVSVKAAYPLDNYRKYSYPRRADAEQLPWFLEWLNGLSSTSSSYDGVNVRVVSQASSSAPTLFADFKLEVPAGVAVSIDNLIGELRSNGLESDLALELSSGQVEVRDGKGALGVETGSGDILVVAQEGKAKAETGSGDVTFERVHGERVSIETGSGDVTLTEISAALAAETGSGDIVVSGLVAGATLDASTGSGDIQLAGDLGAVTRFDISTGSGDVTMTASRTPQVQLSISTGSGDIAVDLPASRITRNDRNDMRVAIGTATGTGSISTGSGDVVVRSN